MNIYTLSPTVEASNLVRIRPDGLQLDGKCSTNHSRSMRRCAD